jgi:hypothetical protein
VKSLIQNSKSLGQDLNPGPPVYEAGVLTALNGDVRFEPAVMDVL